MTTFGESHGPGVGVVVDGCPAGLELDASDVQKELDRRKPGSTAGSTARAEEDRAEIMSGVFEGKTTGAPVAVVVFNKDADSSAYRSISKVFRPGHADYSYFAKFRRRDWRGGGRSSGRETLARVAAGAIAKKLLGRIGVRLLGRVVEISGERERPVEITGKNLPELEKKIYSSPVRCADSVAEKRMVQKIEAARKEGDSVGGVVEVVALGVPPGLGEPVFDKLDGVLAHGLMSIGAVKGVEIGNGFGASKLTGSENNDFFELKDGKPATKTNRHGGILGGISTGMPIVARISVKPTPSVSKEQETVDEDGKRVGLKIAGRHDACICPRIVPVAEAMTALVLADAAMVQGVLPRKF